MFVLGLREELERRDARIETLGRELEDVAARAKRSDDEVGTAKKGADKRVAELRRIESELRAQVSDRDDEISRLSRENQQMQAELDAVRAEAEYAQKREKLFHRIASSARPLCCSQSQNRIPVRFDSLKASSNVLIAS